MLPLVHMIWLQGEKNIPERFRKNLESWRRLIEVKVWDEKMIRRLIKAKFLSLIKIYDEYPIFVQRADLGRYVILHEYGGLYLDIDLKPKSENIEILWQRLAEVSDGTIVMPGPNVPYIGVPTMNAKVCNWFMYTPKAGLAFLKTCLENIHLHTYRNIFQLRSYYVSASTGAIFLTKYMDETCQIIKVHDILINEYAGTWAKFDDQDAIIVAFIIIMVLIILLIIVYVIRRYRRK